MTDGEREAQEDRLRGLGWNGLECKTCFVKRTGRLPLHFRVCPQCGVGWS
jgi:hypothetical protein